MPDGQQIAVHAPQVGHGFQDLIHRFAHAHDDAGLGHGGRVDLLGLGQQVQRQPVIALGPHPGEHPDGGLDVVVQHGGPRVDDPLEGVRRSGEVGNQDFDTALRHCLSDPVDARGEDISAAVREVVAIDRSNDAVAQAHRLDRLGQPLGLLQVDARGTAGRHGAVVTPAGADIPEDHESGGAPAPTLPDVGAVGLLADRVQFLPAHQLLELDITGAARHLDLEPLGQARPQSGLGRSRW